MPMVDLWSATAPLQPILHMTGSRQSAAADFSRFLAFSDSGRLWPRRASPLNAALHAKAVDKYVEQPQHCHLPARLIAAQQPND